MTPIRSERVTSALHTLLDAELAVPVGDHGTDNISTVGSYTILWKIDGGEVRGSIGDPHQDLTLVYQIDSVGRSRNQCEGLADLVRTVVVGMSAAGGHTYVLAGTSFTGGLRTQQTTGMPTPEGVDDTGQEVWTQRERFEIDVHRV